MVEWGSPKFLVRFINHCFYSYFFKLFFGKFTFRVQIYDVGGSTCFFVVSSKTLWSIVNDITPTTIWSSVHLTSSPAHLNLPQSSAHSRSRPSYRHLSDLLASSRNPSPQVHLSLSQSRVYSCPSQAKPHLKSQSSFAGRLVKQMHGWSTYPLVVGQTQCTYQLIHLYCKVLQRPRGKDWRSPKGFQPSATSHLELRPCSHRSNPYHYHRRLDNVLSLCRAGHPRAPLSGFPTLGELKRRRQQSWIQQGIEQIQPRSQPGLIIIMIIWNSRKLKIPSYRNHYCSIRLRFHFF